MCRVCTENSVVYFPGANKDFNRCNKSSLKTACRNPLQLIVECIGIEALPVHGADGPRGWLSFNSHGSGIAGVNDGNIDLGEALF